MPSAPSTIIPLPQALECMAETAISYVSLGFPPPQPHNTANNRLRPTVPSEVFAIRAWRL